MEKKMSKKALEIVGEIKKQYGDDTSININIYYGAPDARFKRCWWAFANVSSGLHAPGRYGQPLRISDTLSGLAIEGKYESVGCGSF